MAAVHQHIEHKTLVVIHQGAAHFHIAHMRAHQHMAVATTGGAAADVGINIVRVFHAQIGIADLALPYSKAVGNGFAKGYKLAPHRPFRQP